MLYEFIFVGSLFCACASPKVSSGQGDSDGDTTRSEIFEVSKEGIVTKDVEHPLYVEDASEEGFEPEDLRGQEALGDFLSGERDIRARTAFVRHESNPRPFEGEVRVYRRAHDDCWRKIASGLALDIYVFGVSGWSL